MAVFPASIATDVDLGVASLKARSQLAVGINATQTTLAVGAGHGVRFAVNNFILIESEQLRISGIVTDTLTVVRGVNGSAGAIHAGAIDVVNATLPKYQTALADEVKAIEAAVAIGASSSVDGEVALYRRHWRQNAEARHWHRSCQTDQRSSRGWQRQRCIRGYRHPAGSKRWDWAYSRNERRRAILQRHRNYSIERGPYGERSRSRRRSGRSANGWHPFREYDAVRHNYGHQNRLKTACVRCVRKRHRFSNRHRRRRRRSVDQCSNRVWRSRRRHHARRNRYPKRHRYGHRAAAER